MHKGVITGIFVIINIWSIMGDDYYELLGVSRTADLKEIRRAFKKLALMEHPDKHNLTKAYETLKDRVRRRTYDTLGEDGLSNSNNRESYYFWNNGNNFQMYKDTPWIITLDDNEYFENVINSKKVWFINFYSPSCSHCHKLAPIWKTIAKELNEIVNMAVVNCQEDQQLCNKIGIQSYPTIMHYPKNSKQGIRYLGEKTYTSITNFILNELEGTIREINESLKNFVFSNNEKKEGKSVLIFVCGANRNCFTSAERTKIATIFENVIDVRICFCDENEKCKNVVSQDTNIIYLSMLKNTSWSIEFSEKIEETEILINKILEYLPEPYNLDADEFVEIRKNSAENKLDDSSWLLFFYTENTTEINTMLKKLSNVIGDVKLGKVNCARHSKVCSNFGINHYPMWAILKPGGAFEWYHGKSRLNHIVKFLHNSRDAINVWTLSEEQVTSIMKGNADKAWFLDWYAPWCPPCMNFVKQFRKASKEFDRSTVRFGTIDCTIHSRICREHNIRSYPTAMLVNGSNIHQFTLEKTAINIVRFIKETQNPTVIKLTSKNFKDHVEKKKKKFIWLIDYFVTWCAPCQQLASELIDVANSLSGLSFIKVASVDCQTESTLCASHGIRSYPDIRMYQRETNDITKIALYTGYRDSFSILKWVIQFFPIKLRYLNPTIFEEEVLGDRNVWIVDYYVPWSEDSKKLEIQIAIAAQLLKKRAKFGLYHCGTYSSECKKAGIKSYPTVIAYDTRYRGGKKITNGYRIDGITAKDIEQSFLHFVTRVDHDEL